MKTIQRLRARARLDDPRRSIADARAQADAGDDDWRRWLDQYERGEALVVHLEVWVEFEDDGLHELHVQNRGVWVEKDVNPPKLEAQIAEIVDKDFPHFAEQLRERGFECDANDLAGMYVHLELDDALRGALRDPHVARRP